MGEMSIAQLAAWLHLEASNHDAFGPTAAGDRLRLAASLLVEMERFCNTTITSMQADVNRLERELAWRQV